MAALSSSSLNEKNINFKIDQRKKEYLHLKGSTHPNRLLEVDGKFKRISTTTAKTRDLQKGIPCSAGRAKGIARVLTTYDEGALLKGGEILVTHSANPGWVPVYLLASGIVTEIGGALSHSAIIAREFGIPMVASIKDACLTIKTGDYIDVDGTRGFVKIRKKSKV